MTKVEKVNELVQTVRTLNWEIRPKIGSAPGGDPPGNPVHQALGELRDHEIAVSQMIRGMSLSDLSLYDSTSHEPASEIGSRQLLSEFGTARESILSLLRNVSEDDWAAAHETPNGSKSMENLVDELIESDRTLVARITGGAS